ncbi:DUF4124 domain-containing protein [uncultured Endozoicomonas sp.]|uniref:DUF4124 domain-containing protein n=1 Tax=uncultured Endozoicomonas sp. TaxID=432652 RepID=UPI0026213A69|nr:DUF4124 domain-containing protein [uncultured Endozoicomonas sp.]
MITMLIIPLSGIADTVYKWKDKRGVTNFSSQPKYKQEQKQKQKQKQTHSAGQNFDAYSKQPINQINRVKDKSSYCDSLDIFISVLRGEVDLAIEIKNPDGQYQIINPEERESAIKSISKESKEKCIQPHQI